MTIKLIMSDIDDTLLTTDKKLTPELKQAAQKLNQMQIPLVLASARPAYGFDFLLDELQISQNPVVSLNGSLVTKGSQVIAARPLPAATLMKVLQIIQQDQIPVQINAYTSDQWFIDKYIPATEIEIDALRLQPTTIDMADLFQQQEVLKLLIIGENDQSIGLLEDKLEQLHVDEVTHNRSNDRYLEITVKNSSKLSGLRDLLTYYQIKPEETLALGDNFNDIPMLEQAGIGVAMENAPQAVKNHADFVTIDNNHNGVVHALKHFIF